MSKQSKAIFVCAECFTASCWHGEFMCERSRHADIKRVSISDLKKLKLEHPDNWSDKKLLAIYGTTMP